ncbi:unnamed protein product [Paramecium primaurelia]|uniref:Uncharacterized protein n=1 Tax=Paramecium primaurelia TaxID=5886 RepID=A0A8S1N2R4_PARPR|nr:unnamed protein product [Paramecium primaurelia]
MITQQLNQYLQMKGGIITINLIKEKINNNLLSQLLIVKVKIIKNSQRLSSTYQLGFSLHRFHLIQIIKPFYCNKQDYLQIPQFLQTTSLYLIILNSTMLPCGD